MLLGIDLGTGSVKVLLLEPEGTIRAEAAHDYQVAVPEPGWAESDPAAWWRALVAAMRSLDPELRAEVTALGLSGQMHGVVLCDATGSPVRPAILWADARSEAQLGAYRALNAGQRQVLANPIAVGMAGPTLLWLREHEPEHYQAARWALQPKDWLRLRLGGEARAEPSDASATLLYDLPGDGWAQGIVQALGLRHDWLAPLVPSAQVAGQLTPEAAQALGLAAGLPLAAGAADAAASALGSGLIRPGQVQVNIGTAMQIFAVRERVVVDPALRTHLYRDAVGGWYAMAAMQNAGLALEWVRRLLGYRWPEMYAEAFALPPGALGVRFLPYLSGERTPHLDPAARGAFVGLGLGHGRAHLALAAFEGVSFALRDGLAALVAIGIDPEVLRLSGGGTLRSEWRQLLADVLGRPLEAVAAASSAQGAALLAGLATGVYQDAATTAALLPAPEPVAAPRAQPALEEAYAHYRELYPALRREPRPQQRPGS